MNGLEKSCFNNLIKMDSRLLALIEFDKALICDGQHELSCPFCTHSTYIAMLTSHSINLENS